MSPAQALFLTRYLKYFNVRNVSINALKVFQIVRYKK